MVVLGQEWLYSRKVVVFGQGDCIRAKWLYLDNNGCIWANWLYWVKLILFGKKCCILGNFSFFGPNRLYSEKMVLYG